MVTDPGTDPTSPPPPPPPPPPGPQVEVGRIVRRPERGWLGGVCAGVAEHFGIDVGLVRVGTVVLALMGPGIPAYLVAWIFFPQSDGATVAPRWSRDGRDDRTAQAIGIGLIIVALSVLWGDWWVFGRGWFLPLGFIALGAWILFRGSHEPPVLPPMPPVPPVPPVPPAPPTHVGSAMEPGVGSTVAAPAADDAEGDPRDEGADRPPADPTAGGEPPDGGSGPDGTAVGPEPPTPPPTPVAKRGGVLAPLVCGALLLWAGVAWLAGVDVRDALAVALCLVGVGCVAGAFVGGSKALLAPALLVAAVLAFVSVVDIPVDEGVGDRTWTVSQVRDLEEEYELAIGEATLDLRALDLTGRSPEVSMQVGVGRLLVVVPDGVEVDLRAEAAAGEVLVLGQRDEGMGVDVDRRITGDRGAGTIELDLQVGLGKIEVVEARPPVQPGPSPFAPPR